MIIIISTLEEINIHKKINMIKIMIEDFGNI